MREVKKGDKVIITRLNGQTVDPTEVTIIDDDSSHPYFTPPIQVVFHNGSNYMDDILSVLMDEWHFADEVPAYDDEAISESYRDVAAKGKTLADFTGESFTAESLAFKSTEEKTLETITPRSLSFTETVEDNVNHPSHYNTGRFETIEMIEEVTKGYDDGYVAYCVGNTLKYLARAPHKHDTPLEDLEKAKRYIEFAITYLNGKEGCD